MAFLGGAAYKGGRGGGSSWLGKAGGGDRDDDDDADYDHDHDGDQDDDHDEVAHEGGGGEEALVGRGSFRGLDR